MKIIDVLKLLESNKVIVILTPNFIEQKLLYDRFRLNQFVSVKSIDKNTLDVKGHSLRIVTPDIIHDGVPSHVLVEFPESIPRRILNKICADNVIFCPEIV